MKEPTLYRQLLAWMQEHQRADIEQIEAAFPGEDRRRIQRELFRACEKGFMEQLRKGWGNRAGATKVGEWKWAGKDYAIPEPQPEQQKLLIASVWDLGKPRTDWPQWTRGRRYAPLGGWNERGDY